MKHQRIWTTAALIVACISFPVVADDLNVLPKPDGPVRMLQDYLRPQMHAMLDARLKVYEALETDEQIVEYQERLKEEFTESLGGFPERTPLNAKTVGVIEGDDYRIENVIYESRPNFHVPANLYLPKGKGPFPGVLVPCGHSETGKAAYQRVCLLLAKNGLAAFCYDAIGQGERKQILKQSAGNPTPHGQFGATTEHSLVGVPAILVGENLATYRIWDGIRGLDYLAGRPEIDSSRLGCTGNSGGGLMTSYLMPLDDRIVAAAPSCFMTTSRYKNERPGPGDAEQNIFGQLANGLDHPDFILMRAPKPTLICAATQDFVPIEGTWEAFRQAKRLYTRMGFAERVDLVEADAKHGFSLHLREGATRWMRRWLLDKTDPVREGDFKLHDGTELQCTPNGQVLLMDRSRSMYQFLNDRSVQLKRERTEVWNHLNDKERIAKVRNVAGIHPLSEIVIAGVQSIGVVERDGYRITKARITPHDGIVLPILLFEPEAEIQGATLYLHDEGKAADAGEGGSIESLVKSGQLVLAVDLRGYGETASTPWRFNKEYFGNNGAEYYIAYMMGKSLVGMRAEDILGAAQVLLSRRGASGPIEVVGVGAAAIPVLHAAMVEPELFSKVTVRKTIGTWERVLETQVAIDQLENTIHGVLAHYDLPDLIKAIGRQKVTLEEEVDATGKPLE